MLFILIVFDRSINGILEDVDEGGMDKARVDMNFIGRETEIFYQRDVECFTFGFNDPDDIIGKGENVNLVVSWISFLCVEQDVAHHSSNPLHHHFEDITAFLDFHEVFGLQS